MGKLKEFEIQDSILIFLKHTNSLPLTNKNPAPRISTFEKIIYLNLKKLLKELIIRGIIFLFSKLFQCKT